MVDRIQIFDCFTFFNELEMLELRLQHHDEYVDYFVICEASQTFRGAPKPLVFQDNLERFRAYWPKIIHVKVDDLPQSESPWDRENFQRNALARGLVEAKPDDQIIISDCDELLTHEALSQLRESRGFSFFDLSMYQFFVNMRAIPSGWQKVYAFAWGDRDKLQDLNAPRVHEKKFFDDWPGEKRFVQAAGWHFTFLGGADRVRQKLTAYSHTDEWQTQMLIGQSLEDQLSKLRDVGGGGFLQYCEVDESFPKGLRDKYQHYLDIGFVKGAIQRIRELETTVAETTAELKAIGILTGKLRYIEARDQLGLNEADVRSVDLAFGRPCTQSSVSEWSHFSDRAADAAGAVNGVISGWYGFHTGEEVDPWWQVDLETRCSISKICIFNRTDQPHRLKNFSILASIDGSAWEVISNKADETVFGATVSDPYVATLTSPAAARYIKVRLDGRNFLHFDECMVFGSIGYNVAGSRALAAELIPMFPAHEVRLDTVRAQAMSPSAERHITLQVLAHIAHSGDVWFEEGDMAGEESTGALIEGFVLQTSPARFSCDIAYQAITADGMMTPMCIAGEFCGSRGRHLPLVGFTARTVGALAESYEFEYAAEFADGTRVGPVRQGEVCQASSVAGLRRMQFHFVAKGTPVMLPGHP